MSESTSTQVLIVDDDQPMRAFVRRNLEAREYQVTEAANGLEALALLHHETFDIVVLDIMMPHLDGYETCRRLRQFSDIPVVVLTAMGDERDIVAALDCGADDCLTKPFGVDELLARLRSLLRRSQRSGAVIAGEVVNIGELRIDLDSNRTWVGETEIDLTRTERSVLRLYAQNLGKTVSHSQVLQSVWGAGYESETHYVRIYLSRIRNKLESGDASYFTNEHGLGYRLG